MSTEERRAPGATRIPFEGLVEVGGALGPTFEAQAVNVSEEGIQLRTAYLPEPGQPLTCRFDAGPGHCVLALGEVAWAQGADRGGEFGVRFTEVDGESVDALKRICGVAAQPAPPVQAGSKVRLHIDGLASPMRAKIRDSHASAVTVGSDLGFLQVGRQLELEDAQSGAKRPANIDRVEVTVDPSSNVPQLIVTLRYADSSDAASAAEGGRKVAAETAHVAGVRRTAPDGSPSTVPGAADDLAAAERASREMKGAVARGFAEAGPALGRLAERAKTTVALLLQRRSISSEEGPGPRRTTAPPPGGALHASGRRVVRGEVASAADEGGGPFKVGLTRRRAALAGGVMVTAVLAALALKKAHHESPAAVASTTEASASMAAASASAAAPAQAASQAPVIAPPPPAPTLASPAAVPGDSSEGDRPAHVKRIHVTPFASGPVRHGNILRLKMDGPIESIEGAQQPTGFAVKIPGRRSTEAAAPLAARDVRIAAIKVTNGSAGAELTVTFKDGVPNYRVSAKGDTLVIALAPLGAVEQTVAKKDERGGQSQTHAKHAHDKNGDDGAP